MLISGAHVIIYSTDAEADRRFLQEKLGLSGVDAGEGWLIFSLPPAELAVHPAEKNNLHEIFFLCDDIARLVEALERGGVPCSPVETHAWGLLTHVNLPGGGTLGIYEPKHTRPGGEAGPWEPA